MVLEHGLSLANSGTNGTSVMENSNEIIMNLDSVWLFYFIAIKNNGLFYLVGQQLQLVWRQHTFIMNHIVRRWVNCALLYALKIIQEF